MMRALIPIAALALSACGTAPVFPNPPSAALMPRCAELPDVPPDEAGPAARTDYDAETRAAYVLCAGKADGLQDYVRLVRSKSAEKK